MKIDKNNLLTRTLTGAVLLVVVVGAVMASYAAFGALLAVICVFCMNEFYDLTRRCGAAPAWACGIGAGVLLLAVNFLGAFGLLHGEASVVAALGVAVLVLPVAFAVELYRKKENPLADIAALVAGVVYVALPLSLFCWMATMMPGTDAGYDCRMPLVIFAVIWLNDVGAYLVGITLGRHRLMERISPKKSWEGFFGGLVFGVLAGVMAGRIVDGAWNVPFWGGLAAVTVAAGVVGDLVESMMKRAAGVKDSGAAIPGHGGFLDRFDSLLFSLPFAFVYIVVYGAFNV